MSVATEALALSRPKKEGVELTSSWITHHSRQVEHLVSDPFTTSVTSVPSSLGSIAISIHVKA